MQPEPGDLKAFEISAERGFLPDVDPETALPAPLSRWDELARDLPRVLLTGQVRRHISALPTFALDSLEGDGALRRAMQVLSFLGHAWVFGAEAPLARVPERLARPWHAVATRLGRPPVLSYASYALDNWRLLDRGGELELENLALVQNFLGGADEDWFVLVHIEIEARAARLLRELPHALDYARVGDARALGESLERIGDGIETMCETLQRMPEHCDPYIYYRRVRPFIHGWKHHPLLPDGVIYEGVAAYREQPVALRGETGAQSGIVPALDAVLAVEHAADPLREYLLEMREYMPPRHRAWITALESAPPIRELVRAADSRDLTAAYDHAVRWLESFRSIHLDYAARYIARQASSGAENPTAVGTGGTPFMPYLRKHRDETAKARVG